MELYNQFKNLRPQPKGVLGHSTLYLMLLLCLGQPLGGTLLIPTRAHAEDYAGLAGNEEIRSISDEYPDDLPMTEDKTIKMTFHRAAGEQIVLDISGTEGEFVVEGVLEDAPYTGRRTYTLTEDKVVIRGDITALDCKGNNLSTLEAIGGDQLIRIDCSGNQLKSLVIVNQSALTHLFCQRNYLLELEIVNSPNLQRIDCYENWIRGDFMTNLIRHLPARSTPGVLLAVNSLSPLPDKENTCFKNDVVLARSLGWIVKDYLAGENNGDGVPYAGNDPIYFPVTIAPTEHGRVWIDNPDPSRIQKDDAVVVHTEAEQGYELSELTANGKDIKRYPVFYISEPTRVEATFKLAGIYSVSLLPIEGKGEVFIEGAEDLTRVPAQTQLKVKCKPALGYRLSAVYAGNENITRICSFAVNEDTEVRVVFQEAQPYEDYIEIGRAFTGPLNLTIGQNMATVMPEVQGGKIREVHYDQMIIDAEENVIRISAMIEKFACPSVQANSLNVTHARLLIDLNCAQNDLDRLDLSGNQLLTKLSCEGNKLSQLDFTNCPKLRFVNVCRNQIAGNDMDRLISSLPVRTAEDQAQLIVVDESFPNEGNECLSEQVARAKAKGWQVYNYNGGEQDAQLYVGGENKNTRSVNSLSEGRLRCYPNPTGSDVTIEGAAPNTLIQLISPTGAAIYSGRTNLDGEARVYLVDFPAGEYILRIGKEVRVIIKR
ncbi:hypothetical protein HQ45_07890 [Porphyromonas crevioricanis]|uniref:T9SS type A sorting domain-containing protein n=1 Tax=Porphyromonas crevioricanis TaxID=393921 RepID=UPI00052C9557|nr:T9SS type A sorting domain-containing protein [Porphyromonas crevioricanis]KGN89207.1 hypothetical protein HQ45_07890 [Porphyromonas crevioricanis]